MIDLDGTFVNVNTFHQWMKFLFIEELKKFHILTLLNILRHALLRYLKLTDHAQMKFSILSISEQKTDQEQIEKFVKSLHAYVNPTILDILSKKESITILATAAPAIYANTIQNIYDFDHIIATPETNYEPWEENIREIKKRNLMSLMEEHSLGEKISILYTDHHDDLSLMKESDFTYLVNPSETTKSIVSEAKIIYEIKNHP